MSKFMLIGAVAVGFLALSGCNNQCHKPCGQLQQVMEEEPEVVATKLGKMGYQKPGCSTQSNYG